MVLEHLSKIAAVDPAGHRMKCSASLAGIAETPPQVFATRKVDH
jgi:hypothetical protein